MNPSSAGWINKFGHIIKERDALYKDFGDLYQQLLHHGFVYGIHLYTPNFIKTEHQFTEDEIAKVNLLNGLYHTFRFEKGENVFTDFVETVFQYYKELEVGKVSFLNKILTGSKTESQLEKLLESRIYLNGNAFSKAFGNSLTNSLLYVDLLIFKHYLRGNHNLIRHAHELEYVTINIAYQALNAKEGKAEDDKLTQLLAASLSYVDIKTTEFDGTYMDLLKQNFDDFEKDYLMDIACLTVWEDNTLDYTESDYVFGIGKALGKSEKEVQKALENV
ncbi:MAG: hypothetical protein HKO09_08005, partial [Croceitalea sp.]|nr:hypothetical protein [Croceitalea sp.]